MSDVPYADADTARLYEALAALQASAGKPRASFPGVALAFGVLAWVGFVIGLALIAWPIGLSAHAVWWLFVSGWGVIG